MRCNIPDADLHQKLDGTVCRYKKKAVFIRVTDGEIGLLDLRKGATAQEYLKIKTNDEDFDISSLELGYMNQTKDAGVLYVTRLPLRRTKQGIASNSIKITPLTGYENSYERKYGYGSNFFFSDDFADMVENKYPSLDSALVRLRTAFSKAQIVELKEKDVIAAVAVSRDCAFNINAMGNINVYYKDSWVGWIAAGETIVRVPSNARGWIVSRYLSHELSWEIQ